MKSISNFEVGCMAVVVLSALAFAMTAFIEKRFDYTLLSGVVFGVVMPPIIRRLQKW